MPADIHQIVMTDDDVEQRRSLQREGEDYILFLNVFLIHLPCAVSRYFKTR